MGCGKKAWAEEIEAEIYDAKIKKHSAKDIVLVMNRIENIEENLFYFIKSEPSLTRNQWNYINSIEETIKELLK